MGDFIRKIDYLNAKDSNDYEDSGDNPSNQLLEVERQCEDITFDELKVTLIHRIWAASSEKMCKMCKFISSCA